MKKIILGITGGIASYKSAELTRLFVKNDFNVQVVATESALQFVTELTLQTLSQNKVAKDLFDLEDEKNIGHIKLADEADVILVAPATADFIAKAAHGMANDLLSTILLATKAPVYFAPSMNVNMYEHFTTQKNLKTLQSIPNYNLIDPESGDLACGWSGLGRMAEVRKIFEIVANS